MYRCTTTKAAFGTPESVLQPESRASPAEGNTTIGHFPACLRVQNITEKMRLEPRSTTRKKGGAPHVLGCTPKWSIRGSWNGTHDSPPSGAKLPHAGRPTPLCAFSASAAVQNLAQQRRLLCPASAEGQELDANDTEHTLSIGRTPRSVPLTTVSPPQRRQRYKTCPNTDACHPQRRRSPKSRPSNDAYEPHT